MTLSFETWVLIVGFLVCLVPATGWKPDEAKRHSSGAELDGLVDRARADMERRRREDRVRGGV